MKHGYVYILMNQKRTLSYVGVTDNLKKSCIEHKSRVKNLFTKRNFIYDLLYFEHFDSMEDAIVREKHLKLISESKRKDLVIRSNPFLRDMAAKWYTKQQIDCYQEGNMV